MIDFIWLWLALLAICAGIAFAWKINFKTGVFAIFLIMGLAPMVVSLFIIPLNEDGYYYLPFSIPYLLAGVFGAAIGLAAAHVLVGDPRS